MKQYIRYSLIIILFFYACSEDKNLQPEGVYIYMNDNTTASNVLTTDVKSTDDNGLLIFGVKGGSSSKFDGDGQLYLQKIDESGNLIWDIYYDMTSGFPASVVTNDNGYTIFWNKTYRDFYAINISGTFTDIPQISSTKLDITDSTSLRYILKAQKNTDGNYLILGVATYDIPDQSDTPFKQVQLIEIDKQLKFKQKLSEHNYYPESFGTIGYEDLAMMKKLDNFFNILIGDNIFISAPDVSGVSIKHIGDPETIYSDENYWPEAIINSDNNTVSYIINNQNEEKIYYIPNLELHSNNQNYIDLQKLNELQFNAQDNKLVNIDVEAKILILNTTENNTILAATTNGGEVVLYLFDSNGDFIDNDKNNPVTIGKGYRYEVVKIIETNNNQNIAIVGFTKVEYKYQRTFLISIDKNELF